MAEKNEKIQKAELMKKVTIRIINMAKNNNITNIQDLMENQEFQKELMLPYVANQDIRETVATYFGSLAEREENLSNLDESDVEIEGEDEDDISVPEVKPVEEPATIKEAPSEIVKPSPVENSTTVAEKTVTEAVRQPVVPKNVSQSEPVKEPIKATVKSSPVSTAMSSSQPAIPVQPQVPMIDYITRNDFMRASEQVNRNIANINDALIKNKIESERKVVEIEKSFKAELLKVGKELSSCKERLEKYEKKLQELETNSISRPVAFDQPSLASGGSVGASSAKSGLSLSEALSDGITHYGDDKKKNKLMIYAGLFLGTIILCAVIFMATSVLA